MNSATAVAECGLWRYTSVICVRLTWSLTQTDYDYVRCLKRRYAHGWKNSEWPSAYRLSVNTTFWVSWKTVFCSNLSMSQRRLFEGQSAPHWLHILHCVLQSCLWLGWPGGREWVSKFCIQWIGLGRESEIADLRKMQDTIIWHVCYSITIHHYCLDTCGPCNNYHYLGHVKNVDDDEAYV